MSEWQSKSDNEINIAVTCFVNDCGKWDFNGVEFYHCGIDGSGYYSVPILDCCNRPSYAWPIIIQCGICITSPIKTSRNNNWVASWNEDWGRWSSGDISHADKNPLRAAMIVYLEANEVKPL